MLKKLRQVVTGMLVGGTAAVAADKEPATKPPVDLNRAVENPKLVAALARLEKEQSKESRAELTLRLREGVYLIPILSDELKTTEPDKDGKTIVKEDSNIKILITSDPQGHSVLPIFTDWNAIREWTKRPVNTLVMPAKDVWPFVLSHSEYAGAVLNPGPRALPLNKELLKFLSQEK